MEVFTIPRSLSFLKDRFAGKAFISGCERVNTGVSTLADTIKEAIQFDVPLLVPVLAVIVEAFQSLPAI